MPRYYTYKNQVKLAPGQKLGFQRGRGYYAMGADGKLVEPVDPFTQQATSSVEAALAPLIAAVERQREDARQQAERERAQLAQYYQWAAGEARNIAPQIQSSYNQAAQTTGTFAKGFSQGMQDALAGNAAEANKLLEQNGAPAGQMLGGRAAPAADALYGLSGALPAQEISAQGAAFSSAAAQLPMTAAGIGGQSLQQLLEEQSAVEQQFADAILEIEQKRPGLIQEAVAELQQMAVEEREQRLKEAAFEFETGYKMADLERKERDSAVRNRATTQRLKFEQERIELQRSGLRFRNRQAEAKAAEAVSKGARPNAGLSAKYGYIVDSNGRAILDAKGKRIPVAKSSRGSGNEATEQQKSVIVKRAVDAGNKALDRLTDRIWGRVDAYYADEVKAKREYEKRLRQNYGTAMAQVIRAISPHLKAIGYTQAQIRAEAARIVATQIKR